MLDIGGFGTAVAKGSDMAEFLHGRLWLYLGKLCADLCLCAGAALHSWRAKPQPLESADEKKSYPRLDGRLLRLRPAPSADGTLSVRSRPAVIAALSSIGICFMREGHGPHKMILEISFNSSFDFFDLPDCLFDHLSGPGIQQGHPRAGPG